MGVWDALERPWQEAFELAWESWCAGSLGIGAVVVDPDGDTLARGRNRVFEDTAPPGQLAGNRIAHAELNALAQLDHGSLEHHRLYTTLEPCLGCTGAIRLSRVGSVSYAAGDPLWSGVNALLAANVEVLRRWHLFDGPRTDALSVLGFLLPLVRTLERHPTSSGVDVWRQHVPARVRLAEELVASGRLRRAAAEGALLPDVLSLLSAELDALLETESRT
jgi:tRNA(Arg) A34 adenosine deaminase TadA